MIPGQRQAIILELLRQRGVLAVEDITAQCNCSATSVRRDLHRLEERGLVTRTHGGAVANVHAGRSESAAGSSGILEARSALVDRSDALVVTPTDTSPIRLLIERARRAGVPLISESVNHPGATSLVAVDDYHAGVELGRWVGLHARRSIRGQMKILDVSQEQANCRNSFTRICAGAA